MVLGLIALPTATANTVINPFTGELDSVLGYEQVQQKSLGGESLWGLDSDLDIIPKATIWFGGWQYDGLGVISPVSTIQVGLWKLDASDSLIPTGGYDIDGAWHVNSSGEISPRG